MPLTPNSVRDKTFTVTRMRGGYQMSEVDAFLDEVVTELVRLNTETGDLHAKLFKQPRDSSVVPPLPEVVEPPDDEDHDDHQDSSEATATGAMRTLLLAQRTADQAIAEARAEAAKLVANAKAHAQRLDAETKQRHQATTADLDRRRQELERSVEELRAFEREHRARLRTYLETQLRDFTAQDRVLRLPDSGAQPAPSDQPRDGGPGATAVAPTAVGSRVVVPAASAAPSRQANGDGRSEGGG